jgi:hypothetical protein
MEANTTTAGSVAELWQVDPMRAHGAWVYLFASIASGSLLGSQRAVELPMLVGTGFAGAYLVAAAIFVGVRRRTRQCLLGGSLMAVAPVGALVLGSDPTFIAVAALAALPAAAAVALTRRYGSLATSSLLMGIAAIVMAAPITAVAGGVSLQRAALLFGLLASFFGWRTLRVAASLNGQPTWDRTQLKARGLQEAAVGAIWTLAVTAVLLIFAKA